jgi:hypothetical protein
MSAMVIKTEKKTPSPFRVTAPEKRTSGEEVWRFVRAGQPVTIVTSGSSASAMNEAVVLHSYSLDVLAKE